ncbi:MAG: hypothetical protein B7W98_02425, partial [Parcubacteria group bacterium 20-58-5]
MIGVLDSGSGGLSVLSAIRKKTPHADVLYLGDIMNAPYGGKSQEELATLTADAIRRLQEGGADKIVSACNSVSASLAISLFDTLDIAGDSLIEMAGPTVSGFRNGGERVLLCATPATVRSGLYQNGFRMIGKDIEALAISELAGAIEFGAPDAEIESVVREAFADVRLGDFDTLVLGCTHYPLAMRAFENVLGERVRIFDPAEAVAKRVEERFGERERNGGGTLRFLITKDS